MRISTITKLAYALIAALMAAAGASLWLASDAAQAEARAAPARRSSGSSGRIWETPPTC
jgi:hypothetical protein